MFSVSRHTVRHALEELRRRGIIESRQGSGSRVVKQRTAPRFAETIDTFETLLRFSTETRLELGKRRFLQADEDLAQRLSVQPGRQFLEAEVSRYETEGPDARILSVGTCWVDGLYASEAESVTHTRGIFAHYIARRYGFEIAEVRQTVSAKVIDSREAEALSAEPGAPAITVLRQYFDGAGNIFLAAFSVCPVDRYVIESSFLPVQAT